MKRMLLRWLIDRAADDGRALTGWARRAVDGDAALRRYEAAARGMVDRLRGEADGWAAMDRRGAEFEVGSERGGGSGWRIGFGDPAVWAMGAAAAVVIAGLIWMIVSDHQPGNGERPVVGPIPTHHQVPADSGRGGALSAWVRRGRDRLEEASERVKSETAVASGEALRWVLRGWVVEPVDRAATFTGRTIAMLDDGAKRERDALAGDVRAAMSFYTERLSGGGDRR